RVEGPNGTYGGGTDAPDMGGGPWRDIHLRVEVLGSFYRFLYSFDGVDWVEAATRSCPLPPTEIGIFCKTWGNLPAMSTTFADLIYEPFTPPGQPPTMNATWQGPGDGVTAGLYTDAQNWNPNVVPGDSNTANFTGDNVHYLVAFPPEGRRTPNRVCANTLGSGAASTVTFDTLGTHWMLDRAYYGVNSFDMYPSFQIQETSGPMLMLSNAVWTFYHTPTVASNILETGWFNMQNPDPLQPHNSAVYVASASGGTNVLLFKAGSSSRVPWYQFRGKGLKNLIRYEGGAHEVMGNFIVKNECNNFAEREFPAEVEIVGDTVLTVYGGMGAAHSGEGATAIVTVEAGGTLDDRGGLGFAHGADSFGIMNVRPGGTVTTPGNSMFGRGQRSNGILNIDGGTFIQYAGRFRAGENGLSVQNDVITGTSTGTVNITSGVFLFTSPNEWVALGDNGGRGIMNVRGGTCRLENCGGFLVGTYYGNVTINGTTTQIPSSGRLNIESGLFYVRGSENSSIINGEMEMSGGEYIQDSKDLNIGSAELIMRGGRLQQNGVINVGNGGVARVRLYGGVLRAARVLGYPLSSLFADGGTIQIHTRNGTPSILLSDLDVAELTGNGLTIDTASGLATLQQAFTDAPSEEGLLTVTGRGTAIFDAVSEHSQTLVDDATLQLAPDAVPGLNVAVINGGGFYDPDGSGMGGVPLGLTYSEGRCVWEDTDFYTFIGFDRDDRLVVVNEGLTRQEADALGIRDGVCFEQDSALVSMHDGELTAHYSDARTSLAQRTAIGQAADGTVILMVTEGRTAAYLGANHNDMVNAMLYYHAVSAGMLDGGSSAAMGYSGYIEKYDMDTTTLNWYQKLGMVNSARSFIPPRPLPTYFGVKSDEP
ncbi:MAG: phosphodiester glycosidase family protein, partial [Kiritimatiellaeota bacterium]|nr:phosphodiester glycosidase family protein [Kiritimatiellota bacterium]